MQPADVPRWFEVRTATVENALTMAQLEAWYGLTPESGAAALCETCRGWVYEIDDVIVGFAQGDSTRGELTVIAVLPGYEGQGIGYRLLDTVTRWLLQQGCAEPWLMTADNPGFRAYGFYQSQGWQATDEKSGDEVKFVYTGQRPGRATP